jgi:hypothetical protein
MPPTGGLQQKLAPAATYLMQSIVLLTVWLNASLAAPLSSLKVNRPWSGSVAPIGQTGACPAATDADTKRLTLRRGWLAASGASAAPLCDSGSHPWLPADAVRRAVLASTAGPVPVPLDPNVPASRLLPFIQTTTSSARVPRRRTLGNDAPAHTRARQGDGRLIAGTRVCRRASGRLEPGSGQWTASRRADQPGPSDEKRLTCWKRPIRPMADR